MHTPIHKPYDEDEDSQSWFDIGTEHTLMESPLFTKTEICMSLAMKQGDDVKGKDMCLNEDAGVDEGKATHNLVDILASDECIDNPVNNMDSNEEHSENEDTGKRVRNRKGFIRRKGSASHEQMHHTKSELPSNFGCVLAAVSLLMNGRPLAVKPSKKVVHFIILILSGLFPTAASPVQENYEYKLLQTPTCNYGIFIRPETCEKSENMLNAYIEYCGFADLCNPGSKPVCVYSDGGEMMHICSPIGLTCQKGYRRRVSLKDTDSNVVIVQEEKCPQGRYQPNESSCYDACANRHEDILELPAQYAIYSKGDNVSPPLIYCDFEKGFYNLDGKFLHKYDEEFRFHPSDCTSLYDYNPCASGLYPIPNGTCVFPCEEGFKRDVHDVFQCKELSRSPSLVLRKTEIVSSTEKNLKHNEFSQIPEKTAETNMLNMTTKNARDNTKTVESLVPDDWHVTVVIVMVCAALILSISGVAVLLLEHQNKRNHHHV